MSSTSRDYSRRASTRYRVSNPVTVHVQFQVCSAWLLCGVLLSLPWHIFQVPRHTFQRHHVTSSWIRRQTFDRFRDVYTILCQTRTTHGSTPKQRCLLSFENRIVEFLRKKRFQRRHPDVFCQRMALTIPCVSFCVYRLIKSSSRSTVPCSSTSLALPGERISLSNPLALPVVKGSQRLCTRRQASSPSPDPEPTRMSNDSPSTRVISTEYS